MLAGDSVHAFGGGGILIASAFMADLRLSFNNRRAALIKVSLAGAVTEQGGVIGYALAHLIPQLQKRVTAGKTAAQIAWLAIGIGLVTLISRVADAH